MTPTLIGAIISGYFLLLIIVSRLTSGKGDNQSFFTAGKSANWMVVAFGMIGASLSGVTFISVPGWVCDTQFGYMQMVLGYIVGYAVIAMVLLPLYYRLQLTSIYSYLHERLGYASYKTGASFFLVSRIIGASFRLYLVAIVLDAFVFKGAVDFIWIVVMTIALIWVYTFKGGMKTIIWTDTLQTACMLLAVVSTIFGISSALDLDFNSFLTEAKAGGYSQWFFWGEGIGKMHFLKQFFAGAGIALVMTGLDQDMMQKNLACKNIKDAQKNVMTLSFVLVFINFLFLSLGALLYLYADANGITEVNDLIFPAIALEGGLSLSIGVFFILGLIASAYSSADSALTALTTSFYVDILGSPSADEDRGVTIRKWVHVGMSLMLVIVIWVFYLLNDDSVVRQVFTIAGYTYGPLLGLYAYGLFTRFKLYDRWVPVVCVLAPLFCYHFTTYFYKLGFELLWLNGAMTFFGLLLISKADTKWTELN